MNSKVKCIILFMSHLECIICLANLSFHQLQCYLLRSAALTGTHSCPSSLLTNSSFHVSLFSLSIHLSIFPSHPLSSLPASNISSISVSLYQTTHHPYVLPFHLSLSLYPFPLSPPHRFIPVASTMPSRITTISNSSFSICAIVISQKGLLSLIS